jgi:hypothetical protein
MVFENILYEIIDNTITKLYSVISTIAAKVVPLHFLFKDSTKNEVINNIKIAINKQSKIINNDRSCLLNLLL